MIEIRAHGRGGMGAVTMMILLAKAVGHEGKHSQAFGAYGPERRGAPVRAFCRIDNNPITIRSQIHSPDFIIVLDPSLLNLPEVGEGLKEGSVMIINSSQEINSSHKTHTFDASKLAQEVMGKEIVNTAMLGVFAKVTGLVKLESILKALEEVFSGKLLEVNKSLVERAFNETGESQ